MLTTTYTFNIGLGGFSLRLLEGNNLIHFDSSGMELAMRVRIPEHWDPYLVLREGSLKETYYSYRSQDES